LLISSCSVAKKATENKDVQIVNAGTKPTDNQVVNKKGSEPGLKIDTIKWSDTSSKNAPIRIIPQKNVEYRDGLDFKDQYNLTLLIPLNSNGSANPVDSRFVQFYAGFLRGLESLDDEGIKLNVKVIDTEEGTEKISEHAGEILTPSMDLVIGPFDRDDVKVFADECKLKSIPMVSPWQTSTKITNENPYYIQIKPNLKEHFLKLAENTFSNYKKGEVAILGKNNKETVSWINFFQESIKTTYGVDQFFNSYFIDTDSLNLGLAVFDKLYKSKIQAVILPNYSYNDEDFLYSSLRRLTAERNGRHITVYGMPILYDSDKIEFDYYHSLNINVVMSDFVDQDFGTIREFRRNFLNMYGEIPTSEAIKAYDLILFLGRNLWKYGRNFQNYLENDEQTYLQSIYEIKKAKSDDSPIADDPTKFDYFENKHLDIIEFKGNKWQKKN
jgi:ABC-type branched-subunit amino acid transport system substrate-binding protein